MGKMLQRFVADTFRDTTFPDLMPRLKELAPQASASERLELALLPMLLPDLVRGIEQVIVAAEGAPAIRGFAGGLLTYVYNPVDILPDESHLGFVDDVFVCALGLQSLRDDELIDLDEFLTGGCGAVLRLLPKLDSALADAIQRFVRDLRHSTQNSATAAPAP